MDEQTPATKAADGQSELTDGLGDAANTSTDELEYALDAVNGPLEYRYAAMLGHARRLDEKLVRIEIQSVRGMIDGWVCVPEVEWDAIMLPNAQVTGAAPEKGLSTEGSDVE